MTGNEIASKLAAMDPLFIDDGRPSEPICIFCDACVPDSTPADAHAEECLWRAAVELREARRETKRKKKRRSLERKRAMDNAVLRYQAHPENAHKPSALRRTELSCPPIDAGDAADFDPAFDPTDEGIR